MTMHYFICNFLFHSITHALAKGYDGIMPKYCESEAHSMNNSIRVFYTEYSLASPCEMEAINRIPSSHHSTLTMNCLA